MTRRKLTLFLAVTAMALQPDVIHGFPSQRYSPYLMQSARQNAVDIPDSNTYRFLRQMELDQIMQRQYSSDGPINSDLRDSGVPLSPDLTPEEGLEMALPQSNIDTRGTDLYYEQQPDENDPILRRIKFVSEEEKPKTAEAWAMAHSRAGDLQEMIPQEEIEEKNIFHEEDSLRQQELLDQAIRQEDMLQDVTLREASSLRQINTMRDGEDPLQQFEIARDAFIYKEEIRQYNLRQQALRQEILRQEALRQEKVFEEDPEHQVTTLRQESDILQQLIRQEELRQENARNLEDAYRNEAEIRQDDPEAEQMLLQKAELQESIRQESEKRQEEAIRQNDILRKKIYSKKKILQQVCINCGPKIVSVSNSHNIQV